MSVEDRWVRLLERLADVAHRRYRLMFVLAAVVVAGSLAAASRLEVDTDVLSLLPPSDPVVKTFRETLSNFGSVDTLLVAVRIPEGVPIDPYLSYVDALGPALGELPEIEYVDYRIGEIDELLASFLPKSMLFLDQAARDEIARRVSDEGLHERAAELRRQISSPAAIAVKQLIRLDPLGMSEVLRGQMKGTRGAVELDWQSGYYLSPDRRLLLILAKPVSPAQDIEFDAKLVAAVDATVAKVAAQWPELAGEGAGPVPEVVLGGGYLIALDDGSLIRRDLVLNVSTSLGTVLPLFWYAFSSVGTLVYALVPIAVGIAATAGLSGLTLTTVSAATTGVAALLVGMAIDFIFVAYGRYVEERRRGASLAEAMRIMGGTAGRGIVTGAVTTTATFYAFFVTDFRGLREMGYLTGTGILFCVAAVLVLLPALLGWREARHERRARRRGEDPTPPLPAKVRGMGIEKVLAWSLRWPRAVLVASLVLTVVLGVYALGARFEDNIQNMRPKGNRGVLVQDEILGHFGAGFEQMMLVISGSSADEVLNLSENAAAGADQLVRQGVLVGSSSIAALMPAPARQRDALAWLASERDGLLSSERIRSRFGAELTDQGLRPAAFEHGLELFAKAVDAARPITLADFDSSPQTQRLVSRYVRHTADGWRAVVYLYPPPKVWKRQAPPEVTALADSLGPQVQLTGVNVVSERLRHRVWRDAAIATVLGTLLIIFLLALDFRRLSEAVLASVPLVLGLIWMVGTMVLIDIQVNIMNIFVVTMIIGIGIDYGIHIVHRYRDEEARADQGGNLVAGLGETAKAVLLASLGTVFGFGSMITSHYPGLQSIGYVAILGTSASAILAVTTLPAALHLLARRRAGRRESALER